MVIQRKSLQIQLPLYTNALISAALPSHPDIERDEIVLPGEVVSPVNPPVGDVFQTRTPLPVRKNHKYTKERPPLVEVGKDHYVGFKLHGVQLQDMI
ncbi:MAG: hypothetical protein Ct9H90mP2_13920 [Dehalococcoidia bacterium]|nr:MAG: hypothetical protein Ct9H90mP2_13920 [Dehalococcoidia bacterium]